MSFLERLDCVSFSPTLPPIFPVWKPEMVSCSMADAGSMAGVAWSSIAKSTSHSFTNLWLTGKRTETQNFKVKLFGRSYPSEFTKPENTRDYPRNLKRIWKPTISGFLSSDVKYCLYGLKLSSCGELGLSIYLRYNLESDKVSRTWKLWLKTDLNRNLQQRCRYLCIWS